MADQTVGRDIDRCPLPHLYPYRLETGELVPGPCSRPAVGDSRLSPVTEHVCGEHLRRAALILFLNPSLADHSWRWTDDQADPCGYCVGWIDTGDWDSCSIDDTQMPIHVDGSIVRRVCRTPHASCAQSVADYVSESSSLGVS